jgi:hypothetical protein
MPNEEVNNDVDYLSNVFNKLSAEKKDSILKKAKSLLRIQEKDECSIKEEKKEETE